jgi:hypothetical protein
LDGEPGDAGGATLPVGMPCAMEMALRKETNVTHLCSEETEVMVTQVNPS